MLLDIEKFRALNIEEVLAYLGDLDSDGRHHIELIVTDEIKPIDLGAGID